MRISVQHVFVCVCECGCECVCCVRVCGMCGSVCVCVFFRVVGLCVRAFVSLCAY